MAEGIAIAAAWSQAATWFAHAGGKDFSRHFVSGLAAMRIDHVVAFRFSGRDGFSCLMTRGSVAPGLARDLAGRYTGGDYAADPNLSLILGSAEENEPRVVSFDPGRIGSSLYRRIFFEEPALGDKLSVIGRTGPAIYYLNLYRQEEHGRFRDDERDLTARIAPLLLAALAQHDMAGFREGSLPPARERKKSRLDVLSTREKDICLLILSGMTEKAMARELGLSPHTVRTYRRRAYAKLGVNDSRALFRLMSPLGGTDG